MENTKVTVGITTYNLEKYIAQCLDSILCQKTTFPFKILIVDDASKDNTPDILKKYKKKHPDKIDIILKEKNGGSLESSNMLFNNIKTPYFSFIDGDDYWLTDTRLQEAIDFLDGHQDYTMYAGNTIYLKNETLAENIIPDIYLDKTYSIADYIEGKNPFIHTSAIILRNVVYNKGVPQIYHDNEQTILNCIFRGEDIRFVEHLRAGKLYLAPKNYSVYRIHNKGIWSGASEINRQLGTCLANLNRPLMFPELKPICQKRLIHAYDQVLKILKNGYQLNDYEHQLLIELLNEFHQYHYADWQREIKPIKKLKHKILKSIYIYCEKKLKRKGFIQ